MVKIKVYLRRKAREEWFMDAANEIKDDFAGKGTWRRSPEGIVWTQTQHGGKVRFLRQYEKDADFIKIWHPSRDRFKQAQAVADFVQWVYHRAKDYVRKIEIPL